MKPLDGPNQQPGSSLQRHLLEESLAMMHYALTQGLKVPAPLVQSLEDAAQALGVPGTPQPATPETEAGVLAGNPTDLPTAAGESGRWAGRLALIHECLTDLVAPARPGTLLLLRREAATPTLTRLMGQVPLVRRLMLASFLSVGGLLAIATSEFVNGDSKNFSLFANSGLSLALNEAFLLFAAAIGASFAALFRVSRYINDRTYDPTYDSVYWVRFMLGLTSGTILALLINIDSLPKAGVPANGVIQGFGKSILALLGGFSADFVYRVLTRFISAAESFFSGDTRDVLALQQKAARVRSLGEAMQVRVRLAKRLQDFQRKIDKHAGPERWREELTALQTDLISPGDGHATVAPTGPDVDGEAEAPGLTAFFPKR